MKRNALKIFLLLYFLIHSTATAVELEKAPRPDAIPTSSAEAIVGAQGCDISPLVAAVLATKVHLGTVHDDSCCNSALGILGNACTILGPDASISGTLLELTYIGTAVQDILLILTTCCAETASEFAQTWTILAELQNTITACCAAEQQDFVNTWTIIAGIIATQTTCCAHEQQDFANTWTILAEIQSTVNTGCATINAVNGCDFLINQSDIPYVITQPGRYCVVSSLTFSSGAAITIQGTEHVLLDLHGHTMNGQQEAGDAAIVINNSAQVTVQNGSFVGTGTAVIISGAQGVQLDNLISVSHLAVGVDVSNSQGVTLQAVALYPAAGADGILLVSSTQCTLHDSRIGSLMYKAINGISALNSEDISIENSVISSCLEGVSAQNCQDILLDEMYFFQNSSVDVLLLSSRNVLAKKNISFAGVSPNYNYNVQNSDNTTWDENILFNIFGLAINIKIFNSNNSLITNGTFCPNVEFSYGNNLTINENRLFGQNSDSSIPLTIYPANNVVITNNAIFGGYAGINLESATQVLIERSVFFGQEMTQIQINEVEGLKINNCSFANELSIAIFIAAQNLETSSVQILNNSIVGSPAALLINVSEIFLPPPEGSYYNLHIVGNRIENCDFGWVEENAPGISTWVLYNNCLTDCSFNNLNCLNINSSDVQTSDGFWLNIVNNI